MADVRNCDLEPRVIPNAFLLGSFEVRRRLFECELRSRHPRLLRLLPSRRREPLLPHVQMILQLNHQLFLANLWTQKVALLTDSSEGVVQFLSSLGEEREIHHRTFGTWRNPARTRCWL